MSKWRIQWLLGVVRIDLYVGLHYFDLSINPHEEYGEK